ncbi:hypothetical protein RvY_02974 [Ramazzottius varieornatus]|uniref:FGFR1 oncogene partner (FOP) N-terminal dimerisation domain-containing protein n=1 Tax=Ramazzottius varieornatus TaxID=947166 RepID=A0A1D1UW03_RAMVA|nr:hypothetical protein RvY_02974 [Ramazzottius varieornatus]
MSESKESQVDPELKEMVMNALDKAGILASLRAQLRAATFLALEGHEKFPAFGPRIKSVAETENGRLCLELVQEFLVSMELEQTYSVFKAEAKTEPVNRPEVAETLNLQVSDEPFLLQMVNKIRSSGKAPRRNHAVAEVTGTTKERSLSEEIKDDFDDELGF